MKKILLVLLLNISFLFSNDSFIDICKNPTPEQKMTINAMVNAYNEFKEEKFKININNPEICEELYDKYNNGFKAIVGQGMSDITFLKYFDWLTHLNLRDNNITDITPLKYLTKLTKLELSSNKVSKGVESLENLPLKDLRIDVTNDTDLKYIGNIQSVERLSIWGGKNSKFLGNLTNLRVLSIASVDIQSLCDLKDLKALKSLDLRWNESLKSLECIDQFPNLQELTIKGTPITDLTPLVNANSIKKFHFHDMPVEDISPLAKMKNLESILFTKTKIKYLSPLKESKSIKFAEDLSEMFIEEYFNRSLAGCSPKSMKEVREGKSCFEADGKTLKPFWKRWLGL
ncbi:leucine-rich repeat domain-containing protein [Halarcobacter ebronensis]|uniref:Internalin n=1 Tax=Halarcobacter ebronensis TaxID=1462615 RepID=A0A4Q1AKL8_9BACT|nr:leucine-rich repeat domain-containing protein [Halarcobacter ebronensis]QKF81503.1 hypothetical protein AEBR_1004 [Halarcobacter ebronensis]RXK05431.1 hypothetical protein CRV07_07925 [Halarcobacter ebronensis]